jgi:MFS family permease
MHGTKIVFASACLGMLLFGIGLITLGSVASGLQQRFQLDPVASGSLFSILPIGILTGSLLFGPFSDRYGYKIIFLLSCLFLFAGFQGIAWGSLLFLKISVFLFGVGGGAINGASNAAVSDITLTHKGANLSLLGIFFAVGALGMPVLLGIFEGDFGDQAILSSVGLLPVLAVVMFTFVKFPDPKQTQAIPFSKGLLLLRDPILILIGFFLFCQTSFEAVLNNWTTTYLQQELAISKQDSLYALSLYVASMAVMRLIIGSVLRHVSYPKILLLSFGLLLAGGLLLQASLSYPMAIGGLMFLGAGLAAGFPVMLGLVGNRFADLSATAFSLVLTIALVGNMSVNFLMGLVVENYGVRHLTSVSLGLLAIMMVLSFFLHRKTNL